jgi:type IV secretory pathway VirB2 component (pilin)
MFVCYSWQEYHADEKLLDIAIESDYVCATSSRIEVLREVQMPRWFSVSLVRRIQQVARSKSALHATALLTLLLVMPVGALAQGSPFDTGFTAIQSLFTGTIAKVASLVAIVIGGYGFAHGEPGAKKALAGVAAGTGIAVLAVNVLSWLWGV